jgi:hypothetical protein
VTGPSATASTDAIWPTVNPNAQIANKNFFNTVLL